MVSTGSSTRHGDSLTDQSAVAEVQERDASGEGADDKADTQYEAAADDHWSNAELVGQCTRTRRWNQIDDGILESDTRWRHREMFDSANTHISRLLVIAQP